MIHDTITLYYREGSSDKVYQAAIEEQDGAYTVVFAYGRRGSMFRTGTKTPSGVPLAMATAIYQRLIDSKMAKGYTPGPGGAPYIATPNEDRATGIACQLLNTIDESEVEGLLNDPNICAQEKYDGKRVLLQVQPTLIRAINRRGLVCGVPVLIEGDATILRNACDAFTLDGECVGDTYHAFDCLVADDHDIRDCLYRHRLESLEQLIHRVPPVLVQHIVLTRTTMSTMGKRTLLDQLRRAGREGIVFKQLDAPYTSGRPASGGSQLKYKFTQTATVCVRNVSSAKRSVHMVVRSDISPTDWMDVGAVAIPPNHDVPSAGIIIEVRYLYAYPNGCLYQPVYLGVRDDVGPEACTLAQLKIKAGPSEEPEG